MYRRTGGDELNGLDFVGSYLYYFFGIIGTKGELLTIIFHFRSKKKKEMEELKSKSEKRTIPKKPVGIYNLGKPQ